MIDKSEFDKVMESLPQGIDDVGLRMLIVGILGLYIEMEEVPAFLLRMAMELATAGEDLENIKVH